MGRQKSSTWNLETLRVVPRNGYNRTMLSPSGALTFLARDLPGASLDNLLVASQNGNFLGYLTDFLKKSWAKSTLLVKIYLKMTFLGLLSKNQ